MKSCIYKAFAALVMAMAAPVEAQSAYNSRDFLGAGQLYEECKTEDLECVAYVMGVYDTLQTLEAEGDIRGVCSPYNMIAEQAILAFQNYAREHPASLSTNAASVVAAGLHETFPCR